MNDDRVTKDAQYLTHLTVGDLRNTLEFESDPEVLRVALLLMESGVTGYGTGKTARAMIKAALRRAERNVGITPTGQVGRATAK